MIAIYLSLIDENDMSRFEKIYYKYKNLLFYIANGILPDITDAEDAVQEAFIRIAKNMDKIEDTESVATKNFVAIIAKREALRISEKKYKSSEDKEIDLDTIEDTKAQDALISIQNSLNLLPDEYCYLMNLKYVFGYSGKEISEITNLTETNVRQKLFREKRMLEEIINGN